jgi:hypothetical protein
VVGRDRELIRSALSDEWSTVSAMAALTEDDDIDRAMARYKTSLAPLIEQDPEFTGADAKMVDQLLRPIGMKIAPNLSPDQADGWRSAMLLALSDLAPPILIGALKKTIHQPMEFLSAVETVVRDKAADVQRRHDNAAWRLKMLREAIHRAAQPPQPVIENKPNPLTFAEIAAMKPDMRAIGLTNGAVTQDQLDAADVWAQGGMQCAA